MAKPEIRLKGFKGEWETFSLGSLGKTISGIGFPEKEQGGSVGIPFFKVSDMNNEGNEHIMYSSNNYVTQEQIKRNGWHVCEKPSLFFAKVGAAVLLNRKRLVISPCLCDNNTMLYCFDENKWEPYFCLSLFSTINLASLAQTGSLPSYNGSMVEEIAVKIPRNICEQKCIADYFKSLDSMIQGVTKKIASLKQMKQACLVSMFPQVGETTPRVRYKGFKGEWENVSFKDITYLSGTKNRDNLPLESYSISNEKGFVPQNEQFEQGGTMANADKRLYYIVTPDSFAYNPARINVGSIGYDDLDKDVIVSSLYVVFKTDDNTNNYFLNHWFKTPMFRNMIELYQEGGVRLYFFYDKLCQCHFRRPCLAEQEKIASFFTSLDKQISLQEARLEKLKQIKAACLDKMFV